MQNIILYRLKEYAKDLNKVALKYGDYSLTYSELDLLSSNVSDRLIKAVGYEKNSPIVIYEKRGIDFIVLILAVMKSGCFYVPLEDSMPINRVIHIYKDLKAKLIVSTGVLNDIPDCHCLSINMDEMKFRRGVRADCYELNEDDLVYVMYTSGSSGNPKGVKIKYSNLNNLINSFWEIVYKKFDENINVGVLASFSFDASVKQIFCSLCYGHTLVISEDSVKYFGRKIHNFHNKYDIKLCDCTPSHIKLMSVQTAKDMSQIDYMIVGGENLRWENLVKLKLTMGRMPDIINVYGPTECCVDVSYNYIGKVDDDKTGYVSIGVPLDNTELYIWDDEERIIKERNCPGELIVKGKQVGAGYVNIISDSFRKSKDDINGFDVYRTGDLAMYNDGDEIIVISRLDNQVKINGYRIELNEISRCIEEFSKIPCETIVIKNNEINMLISFVVGNFDVEELKLHLAKKLPAYMLPKAYIRIDEIPLNKNGKVDLACLKRIYCEERKRETL